MVVRGGGGGAALLLRRRRGEERCWFDVLEGGGCLGIYIGEGGFTWRRDQGIGIGVGKI